MGTVLPSVVPQTLYVTIRRDELALLKEEREQLQQKVANLASLLREARMIAPDVSMHA